MLKTIKRQYKVWRLSRLVKKHLDIKYKQEFSLWLNSLTGYILD